MQNGLKLARTPDEKSAVLEKVLAIASHNRGTDHLIAQIRSRISKLKQEKEKNLRFRERPICFFKVKTEEAG